MTRTRKALALMMALCLLLLAAPGLAALAPAQAPPLTVPGLSLLPLPVDEPILLMAVQDGRLALLTRRESQEAPELFLYAFPGMTLLARQALEPAWQLDYLAHDHLGFLKDGRPYVLSLMTATLLLYDHQLTGRQEIAFGQGQLFRSAFVQGDGAFIWAADLEGNITRFDVAAGRGHRLTPQLPGGWDFEQFLAAEGGRLRSRYDHEGFSLVAEMDGAGGTSILPVLPGASWFSGSRVLLTGTSLAMLHAPGQEELTLFEGWGDWESPLFLAEDSFLTIHHQGEQVLLRRYDLARGLLQNRLNLPQEQGGLYFSQVQDTGEGRVLILYQSLDLESQALILWDPAESPLSEAAGLTTTSIRQFAAVNDALAREIAGKHQVTIRMRQEGSLFVNEVYAAQPNLEELRIREALTAIDAFLHILPEGLLQEALLPPVDSLAIHLTGAIQQTGQEGIMAAAGFSAQSGSQRLLVLDIRDTGLARILAHEFMHVLEDRLEQSAADSRQPLLWYWGRLGPGEAPDYGFHHRYTDSEGYTLYDAAYTAAAYDAGEHPDQVWFVDAYSRTLPLEDRARLFEHLMVPGGPEEILVYPRLVYKAQLLAALIREAFPSAARHPGPPWEARLPAFEAGALLEAAYQALAALE